MNALTNATTENLDTIGNSLRALTQECIEADDTTRFRIMLELAVTFRSYASFRNRLFWDTFTQNILNSYDKDIKLVTCNHLSSCILVWWQGFISIAELIKCHGLSSVFELAKPIIPIYHSIGPSFNSLVFVINYIAPNETNSMIRYKKQNLEEIGETLLTNSPPWCNSSDLSRFSMRLVLGVDMHFEFVPGQTQETVKGLIELGALALFGVFALLAIKLDMVELSDGTHKVIKILRKPQVPSLKLLNSTFLSRYASVPHTDVQAELTRCGFNEEQQAFIWRWIRREINLVEVVEGTEQDDELGEE